MDRRQGHPGLKQFAGAGADELHGAWANSPDYQDELHGEAGGDLFYLHDGNDSGSGLVDRAYGDGGNDINWGGAGDDFISAGDGDDQVNGLGGADTIYGGTGEDYISGGPGADTLYGDGACVID